MSKFNVGDTVVFINKNKQRQHPEWYPPSDVTGVVISVSADDALYFVKWEIGTTTFDDEWWCCERDISAVKNM